MNHEILLIIYLVILALQVFCLIKSCHSNRFSHWIALISFEAGTAALSFAVMHYYNTHPGYMMSTLGHVIWSLGAAACYGFMAALSVVIFVIIQLVKKKKRMGR